MDDLDKFLVFDIGSSSTKAGYAGEDYPTIVFDTVCGKPLRAKEDPSLLWTFKKEEALDASRYEMRKPLEWGKVCDWEAWEEVVSHCYMMLEENPSDQPTFLIEPQQTPRENKAKAAQLMFEGFQVPALHLGSQGVLALYAAHNQSGTIVHVGNDTADVIPYLYGEARHLQHAAVSVDISGSDVTDHLAMLLSMNRGESLFTKSLKEEVKGLKEEICYVSLDFEREEKRSRSMAKRLIDTSHQLSNSRFIEVGAEKFMAPEILFKPFRDSKGIHEVIVDAISKCDLVTRFELYHDIVLAGGTTMIKGFKERLELELKKLVPNAPIRIHESRSPHLLPWQGASFVAQIPAFNYQGWIGKREYEEIGETIVFRKCAMVG